MGFAKLAEETGVPLWVRHVLVPGFTDREEDLKKLGEFINSLQNVEKVEILPYHKMGEYKWEALGIPNKLVNTRPPSQREMERAYTALRKC
ncbi:hypothetical protein [Pseudalkalibacillus caeni]|uniref:[Formate-C-acetyltransferase]-activating enzyme n=1 Tax=Exobacillus caeni TaxID=2574798 RepID=A0A5R9FDM1_9BACL|nr:hypothetical protein FCL54_01280 [Pseudalkalibacillus caeni]